MTYSEKFKAARKAAGLTQEACAARLGVPARTLENWEAGSRTPPDYVQRLVLEEMDRITACNRAK